MDLNVPITHLPHIGPQYAHSLEKMGIHTLTDLLNHFPFRYADLSKEATISSLQIGDTVTLSGIIVGIQSVHLKFGKTLQKAIFSDGTGTIKISWFNQPYLVKTFEAHPQISISGTVKVFAGKPTFSSPQYEIVNRQPPYLLNPTAGLHTGRLVPVYPETTGITSRWLRARIDTLLKLTPPQPDWLPDSIVNKQQLLPYNHALRTIHFPDSVAAAEAARNRLSFDELFLWQLLAQTKKALRQNRKNYFTVPKTDIAPYLKQLPFTLTAGQQQAVGDILADLNCATPMNRLLQGDVGSGKTVVAAAAVYCMAQAGFVSVLMAPTEILATQHAATLRSILEPLGIPVSLATRTHKGPLDPSGMIIGTQAVLFRQLPDKVGLVIIDEQHRFGVGQRSQLLDRPQSPHLLSMTATPIPRTVTLTLYADLDISIIDELPTGRLPVKTWVVPEHKRLGAYQWIESEITKGGQVFVVCPLIFDSESETMSEVKAVESEYQRLSTQIFPHLRIGLVHGGMKAKEKDVVIADFSQKKYDILVATPVIEVGIDIPGATIMVIEGAERFGLAALHQLRGRVGRNSQQGYCLLFPTSDQTNALTRLKSLETIQSGFQLAELDLKLRGPGNVYGTEQSGFLDLKVASFNDGPLIVATHQEADHLLKQDPQLSDHPAVRARLDQLIATLAEPN